MTATCAVSRTIIATPKAVFRALIDPESIPNWRSPPGVTLTVLAFEAREGGLLRFAQQTAQSPDNTRFIPEIIEGRLAKLAHEEMLVEELTFTLNGEELPSAMWWATTLLPVRDGTKVTMSIETMPSSLSAIDHKAALEATLKRLANLLE